MSNHMENRSGSSSTSSDDAFSDVVDMKDFSISKKEHPLGAPFNKTAAASSKSSSRFSSRAPSARGNRARQERRRLSGSQPHTLPTVESSAGTTQVQDGPLPHRGHSVHSASSSSQASGSSPSDKRHHHHHRKHRHPSRHTTSESTQESGSSATPATLKRTSISVTDFLKTSREPSLSSPLGVPPPQEEEGNHPHEGEEERGSHPDWKRQHARALELQQRVRAEARRRALARQSTDEAYLDYFQIHPLMARLSLALLAAKPSDPVAFTRNWLADRLVSDEEEHDGEYGKENDDEDDEEEDEESEKKDSAESPGHARRRQGRRAHLGTDKELVQAVDAVFDDKEQSAMTNTTEGTFEAVSASDLGGDSVSFLGSLRARPPMSTRGSGRGSNADEPSGIIPPKTSSGTRTATPVSSTQGSRRGSSVDGCKAPAKKTHKASSGSEDEESDGWSTVELAPRKDTEDSPSASPQEETAARKKCSDRSTSHLSTATHESEDVLSGANSFDHGPVVRHSTRPASPAVVALSFSDKGTGFAVEEHRTEHSPKDRDGENEAKAVVMPSLASSMEDVGDMAAFLPVLSVDPVTKEVVDHRPSLFTSPSSAQSPASGVSNTSFGMRGNAAQAAAGLSNASFTRRSGATAAVAAMMAGGRHMDPMHNASFGGMSRAPATSTALSNFSFANMKCLPSAAVTKSSPRESRGGLEDGKPLAIFPTIPSMGSVSPATPQAASRISATDGSSESSQAAAASQVSEQMTVSSVAAVIRPEVTGRLKNVIDQLPPSKYAAALVFLEGLLSSNEEASDSGSMTRNGSPPAWGMESIAGSAGSASPYAGGGVGPSSLLLTSLSGVDCRKSSGPSVELGRESPAAFPAGTTTSTSAESGKGWSGENQAASPIAPPSSMVSDAASVEAIMKDVLSQSVMRSLPQSHENTAKAASPPRDSPIPAPSPQLAVVLPPAELGPVSGANSLTSSMRRAAAQSSSTDHVRVASGVASPSDSTADPGFYKKPREADLAALRPRSPFSSSMADKAIVSKPSVVGAVEKERELEAVSSLFASALGSGIKSPGLLNLAPTERDEAEANASTKEESGPSGSGSPEPCGVESSPPVELEPKANAEESRELPSRTDLPSAVASLAGISVSVAPMGGVRTEGSPPLRLDERCQSLGPAEVAEEEEQAKPAEGGELVAVTEDNGTHTPQRGTAENNSGYSSANRESEHLSTERESQLHRVPSLSRRHRSNLASLKQVSRDSDAANADDAPLVPLMSRPRKHGAHGTSSGKKRDGRHQSVTGSSGVEGPEEAGGPGAGAYLPGLDRSLDSSFNVDLNSTLQAAVVIAASVGTDGKLSYLTPAAIANAEAARETADGAIAPHSSNTPSSAAAELRSASHLGSTGAGDGEGRTASIAASPSSAQLPTDGTTDPASPASQAPGITSSVAVAMNSFLSRQSHVSLDEVNGVRSAVTHYEAFVALDETQLETVVRTMSRVELEKDVPIISEGDATFGQLILVMSGKVTVSRRGQVVRTITKGQFYGEMEMAYHVDHSNVTLIPVTDETVIYSLTKKDYQKLVTHEKDARRYMFLQYVNQCVLFQGMPPSVKTRLADALRVCRIRKDTKLTEQGSSVQWMYLIMSGTVKMMHVPGGPATPLNPSLNGTLSMATGTVGSATGGGSGSEGPPARRPDGGSFAGKSARNENRPSKMGSFLGGSFGSATAVCLERSQGQLVGESEFVFKCKGLFTAVAATPVQAARVGRLHFEAIMGRQVVESLKRVMLVNPDYYFFERTVPEDLKKEMRNLLFQLNVRSAMPKRVKGRENTSRDQPEGSSRRGKKVDGRTAGSVAFTQSSTHDAPRRRKADRAPSGDSNARGDAAAEGVEQPQGSGNDGRRRTLKRGISDVARARESASGLQLLASPKVTGGHGGAAMSSVAGRSATMRRRAGTSLTRQSSSVSRWRHVNTNGELIFSGSRNLYRFPAEALSANDSLLIGVVVDGTIIRWNATAQRVTGFAPYEVIGQSIYSLIPNGEHRQRMSDLLALAYRYAGQWANYVRDNRLESAVFAFQQNQGLYQVGLALSVIPSMYQKTGEVLMLVGKESKYRAANTFANDVAKWLDESLKPQLRQFQRHMAHIESQQWQVTVEDALRVRGHLDACMSMVDQFSKFSLLNMENVSDSWRPMHLPVLLQRFATEAMSYVQQYGHEFYCNVDDVQPRFEVFLDAQQILAILRLLLTDAVQPRVEGGEGQEVGSPTKRIVHVRLTVSMVEAEDPAPLVPTAAPPAAVKPSDAASSAHSSVFGQVHGHLSFSSAPGQDSRPRSNPLSEIDSAELCTFPTTDNPLTVDGDLAKEGGGGPQFNLEGIVHRRDGPSTEPSSMASSHLAGGAGSSRVAGTCLNTTTMLAGMHGGGVAVTPTGGATSLIASLRRIRFELRDDGPTINALLSPEARERMAREMQLGSSAATEEGATPGEPKAYRGAVLDQVEKNIISMGGEVYGFTRPDVDQNVVRVELPLLAVPGSEENGNMEETGAGATPTVGGRRGLTVLLADNNRVEQQQLCQVLWARQHAVVPVMSYKEVVRKLESNTADILVIDPTQIDISAEDYDALQGDDPFDDIRMLSSRLVLVVMGVDFDDWRVQKLLERQAVVELPKVGSAPLVHIAMQEAEQLVAELREEENRIELIRRTFTNTAEGRHKIGRRIGKGAFGDVYEVEDTLTGGKMAMKQMRLHDGLIADEVLQEILAMTSLQHENIIHYFYCEKDSDTALRLYMELANGGTLQSKIRQHAGGGLPFDEIVTHLTDICRGLAYVHGQQYVHGDLKTANLLLGSRGRVKIGDFGTAKHLAAGQMLYTMVGTPMYMAPEVLNADPEARNGYDFKADIWSLGCVVLEMATGQPPFAHLECAQGMGIIKYLSELTDTPDISPLFTGNPLVFEFVRICLEIDPNNRPSAQELLHLDILEGAVASKRAERVVKRAEMLYKLNKYAAVRAADTTMEGSDGGSDFCGLDDDSNATEDYNNDEDLSGDLDELFNGMAFDGDSDTSEEKAYYRRGYDEEGGEDSYDYSYSSDYSSGSSRSSMSGEEKKEEPFTGNAEFIAEAKRHDEEKKSEEILEKAKVAPPRKKSMVKGGSSGDSSFFASSSSASKSGGGLRTKEPSRTDDPRDKADQ